MNLHGHSLLNFLRVSIVVMVLVAVALGATLLTMHFAIHGAEVKIPQLKGMTVADALSQTAGLGLNLEVDNRYYSADVAAGHILTQSPAAGTVVRREWHVRVSESLGPQRVEVPNTVGTDERLAALKLRTAGLAVGVTAHLPYANAPEGTVLAQDPPANAQGIQGPSVNLLVAAPASEAADGYVMPDLSGMNLFGAQATVTRVGLKMAPPSYVDMHIQPVGTGNAPPRPPVPPGEVIGQQPSAGMRVDQNTLVKLTVTR